MYNAEIEKIRSQMPPRSAARTEFDLNVPHYRTLLSSIMDWKKSVIPRNPSTPGEINPDLDFFKMPDGESIIKKMVEVGGDPSRMVIMVATDKVIYFFICETSPKKTSIIKKEQRSIADP